MTFLWREALWLLGVIPVLVAAYVLWHQRRKNAALRYPSLGLVREATDTAQRLRRHLPPLAFVLGLAALLLAVARPAAVILAPGATGTVVLAIDVSLSMAVTDVAPSRLGAAQAAMVEFVKAQPPGVRIGVVAFAGYAQLLQSPTTNREEVLTALDRLELQPYTAIGNGLIAAVRAIHPSVPIIAEYEILDDGPVSAAAETASAPAAGRALPDQRTRARREIDPSAALILVSDGQGTLGVPHPQAARVAAQHGLRVYTVGVGTPYGGTAHVAGRDIHAEFEEEALKQIARITDGDYFHARNADRLKTIYGKLSRRTVLERTETEISVLLTGLGVLLLTGAAVLSVLWFNPALHRA